LGFFASGGSSASAYDKRQPKAETLHMLQCRACPLNEQHGLHNPHMEPTGAENPVIYMLGDFPGKTEDRRGRQMTGTPFDLLQNYIPEEWERKMRWNNVVRTASVEEAHPTFMEIECCRPSIIADIEAAKPKAIFGFGDLPLEWVSTYTGIARWRGRRMPVRIGKHTCWFYPMLHPKELVELRKKRERNSGRKWKIDRIATEDERAFTFDLKRAFAEIEAGLPEPVVHDRKEAERGVEICTDYSERGIKRIEEVLRLMATRDAVGFDYETNRLRPYNRGAKILSFGVSDGTLSFSAPLWKRGAKWTKDQRKRIRFLLKEFLFATPVKKVVHNLAFEMEWSAVKFDKAVLRSSFWEDSMVQAVCLDERVGGKGSGCLSLDFLVQQYFGFGLKSLSNVDRKALDAEPLEVVLRYNAMDAKYHLLLWRAQGPRLEEQKQVMTYQRRLKRVPTAVLTQIRGVPVDPAEAKVIGDKYLDRVKTIEAEIMALPSVKRFKQKFKETFKPMSNTHVTKMFRDMLGRVEGLTSKEERDEGFARKHKSDSKYAVDEDVLKAIGTKLALKLLVLRKAHKRFSTYIEPMLEGADTLYEDGSMHPTLNTCFSEPGRTSSEGPNIQNYPKRDGEAKEVRKPVKVDDDEVFMAVDQGQIQARIIAMATKDKVFVQSLWDRYDVHQEWAERIAHVCPSRIGGKAYLKDKEVMKNFRGDVKNQWTFPLFFGAQIKSVAGYLHIEEDKATQLVEEFWDQFNGVRDWHETLRTFYHKYGYVKLLTGARVRSPLSFNEMINYPIQGTEAEMVMDCHNRISEMESDLWDKRSLDLPKKKPKGFRALATEHPMSFQPAMMIHDDLTFRVPKSKVDQYSAIIVPEMLKKTFKFVNVPLTVEMALGDSWYSLKEVEKFSSDKVFQPGEGGW